MNVFFEISRSLLLSFFSIALNIAALTGDPGCNNDDDDEKFCGDDGESRLDDTLDEGDDKASLDSLCLLDCDGCADAVRGLI